MSFDFFGVSRTSQKVPIFFAGLRTGSKKPCHQKQATKDNQPKRKSQPTKKLTDKSRAIEPTKELCGQKELINQKKQVARKSQQMTMAQVWARVSQSVVHPYFLCILILIADFVGAMVPATLDDESSPSKTARQDVASTVPPASSGQRNRDAHRSNAAVLRCFR